MERETAKQANMTKLICVSVPEGYEGLLTRGKIYEGEENDQFYFNVSNDRAGNKDTYLKSSAFIRAVEEIEFIPKWTAFVKLESWRARQLKGIGI
jgi:hypothetical protein